MKETQSKTQGQIQTILAKEDYIYSVNTQHQLVVLDPFFEALPNIVSNLNRDYAFCMDGSTVYVCTTCHNIRQILRFTVGTDAVGSVPEPLFTEQMIPDLTHMIYFKGYLCAITENDILVYDVSANKRVQQPLYISGIFQGIAGFQDTLYVRTPTHVLQVPFQQGILNYNHASLTQTGPFALYFQLDPDVQYLNIRITLPIGTDFIELGFDETLIQDHPVSFISATDNPTLYDLDQLLTYRKPSSYTDLVICGTICFLSGALVLTDQGQIRIEYLDTKIHTIRKMKILAISITYSLEDTLVCIPKNAFSKYVPLQDTFLSNNHKVFHGGEFVEACKLVGRKGVYEIPYQEQLLYNVILREYTFMNVNNLICETLDPKNPVAQTFIL